MSDGLVVTHVFSLEQVLCLARPGGGLGAGGRAAGGRAAGGRAAGGRAGRGAGDHAAGTPAVLTISRGGRPCEPRLVLFGDQDAHGASRLGTLVFSDAHVSVRCGDQADAGRRELADVLTEVALRVSFGVRERLRRRLDQYPGCTVAVGRRRNDHLAVVRGGLTVATRSSCGASEMWASVFGSFLYCWAGAGLALGELPREALIVGRFTASAGGRPPVLETVGRVQVSVRPAGSPVRRLAS